MSFTPLYWYENGSHYAITMFGVVARYVGLALQINEGNPVMRMFIEMTLLLFLPFIIYGIWGWFGVKRGRRNSIWNGAPLKVLGSLGLAMVLGMVGWKASYNKAPAYSKWHPSKIVDGKLVPGYFETLPPPKKR